MKYIELEAVMLNWTA